ncbi:unnamed protein product, partial [marine sediment metagenome]
HGVVPIAMEGTGSNDFIIEHGHNGFLTPPQSPEAIAQTVRMLRSSQRTYEQVIIHGYEYAQEHTLDKEVDKLWDFVFSRLKGKNNG